MKLILSESGLGTTDVLRATFLRFFFLHPLDKQLLKLLVGVNLTMNHYRLSLQTKYLQLKTENDSIYRENICGGFGRRQRDRWTNWQRFFLKVYRPAIAGWCRNSQQARATFQDRTAWIELLQDGGNFQTCSHRAHGGAICDADGTPPQRWPL